MFRRKQDGPPLPRKPKIIAASPVGAAIAVAAQRRQDMKAAAADAAVRVTAPGSAVDCYTWIASLLHWLIAIGVLTLLPLGVVMKRAPLGIETKFKLYQLHKSIGLVVLALMLLRVLWRLRHAPPPLPSHISLVFRGAAHIAHLLLYALLIAMPVTGWLLVSSAALPIPTRVFELFTLPHLPALANLPPETRSVWEAFYGNIHSLTGLAIGVLVALHVLAVALHRRHGIDLLARMLPWRRVVQGPQIRVVSLILALALAAPLAA